MNNNIQPYIMTPHSGLGLHFPGRILAVRDTDEDFRAEVRVRSGDYLHTVATELDTLAHYLATEGLPEAEDLKRLAAELLYVGTRYELTHKP